MPPPAQQQPQGNAGSASLQDVVTQLKAIAVQLTAIVAQLKANG